MTFGDNSSIPDVGMIAVAVAELEADSTDEQNDTQPAETTPETKREAIKRVDQV